MFLWVIILSSCCVVISLLFRTLCYKKILLTRKNERKAKMAILKKSVLGKVSGVVGDLNFRQMYGKNYISTRPKSFTPGSDQNSINRRNRFRTAVKFASSINRIEYLKRKWNLYSNSISPSFSYLVKKIYPFTRSNNLLTSASIIPGSGFAITSSHFKIESRSVQVTIDPLGENTGINTAIETRLCAAIVIFFNNPSVENTDPVFFLPLTSANQTFDLVEPISIECSIPSSYAVCFNTYSNYIGFLSLITLDEQFNPVHLSQTINS